MSHWDRNFHPWAWGLKDDHTDRLSTVNQCTKMARNCGLRLSFVCTAWDLFQVHASEAGGDGEFGGNYTLPVLLGSLLVRTSAGGVAPGSISKPFTKVPVSPRDLSVNVSSCWLQRHRTVSLWVERGVLGSLSGCQVEITKDSTRRPVIRSTTPGFSGYFSTSYLLGIYSYYSN